MFLDPAQIRRRHMCFWKIQRIHFLNMHLFLIICLEHILSEESFAPFGRKLSTALRLKNWWMIRMCDTHTKSFPLPALGKVVTWDASRKRMELVGHRIFSVHIRWPADADRRLYGVPSNLALTFPKGLQICFGISE